MNIGTHKLDKPINSHRKLNNREVFKFSTKANNLEALKGRIRGAKLCEQFVVQAAEWLADKQSLLDAIIKKFEGKNLAVRSSAVGEDSIIESQAGANLSLINVLPEHEPLALAIENVFESYKQRHDNDQVLIQPMVEDVVIAGVVMTRDLNNGSPYYVVNYDDMTGRTDTVTGGAESKSIYIHREHTAVLHSERFQSLLESVRNIEDIVGISTLDLEFCITENDQIYIFQVRPIAAHGRWGLVSEKDIANVISKGYARIEKSMRKADGLAGKTTVYGEMTDWNPAEMIGSAPRPLATSLYKTLITDSVWAVARQQMGYRLVDQPLMAEWCGRPYIDVRLSLNSFLPNNFDANISDRLVSNQLLFLADNRDHHDKLEFTIAVTCRDFDWPSAQNLLSRFSLAENEIDAMESHLHQLTEKLVIGKIAPIDGLLNKANALLSAEPPTKLSEMRQTIENCRNNGTLPFAMLARHGFIGVQLLRSLVKRGVISVNTSDCFMRGIRTIATDVAVSMNHLTHQRQSMNVFLEKYGHLRPGSYDINSPRYDENPSLFLGRDRIKQEITRTNYEPDSQTLKALEVAIAEAQFKFGPRELLHYIASSIKAREAAKFAFTRSLSDLLRALTGYGERLGLTREDLSYLPIDYIMDGMDPTEAKGEILEAKKKYEIHRAVRLPHLITEPNDILVIRVPIGQPTFITNKSLTASTVLIGGLEDLDIDGRIVMIESADPGFDWIFSRKIAGLITKYGGANSHMAIRCAEFSLPAAIGCGERLFSSLSKAEAVELNCSSRRILTHDYSI